MKPLIQWITLLLIAAAMPLSAKANVQDGDTKDFEAQVAAQASQQDDGWKLASALDVRGKGGVETCGIFAQELQRRFTLAGGESHILIYDWTDNAGFSDRHAIFIYRDATGRYWGIDNRHPEPKWLAGTTPATWVASWEPTMKRIRLVAEVSHPRLAGRTADKNRYDRLTHAPEVVW